MKFNLIKKNQGFALLFSVLISSLLLSIGLSIFRIALKELSISTSARQSIYSFFAADSGRERVLYEDTKLGSLLTYDGGQISEDVDGDVDDVGGPNYKTTITKVPTDKQLCPVTNSFCTVIESRGYDSKADDRLERAIRQTY